MTSSLDVDATTTGRTSSRTRRTSSTPTSQAGRPAGVRGAAGAGRDALADATGSTPATSTSRTSRSARASEEYLDSEKYETKKRALDGPLLPLVRRLNRIRRENPALQRLDNVAFLETENER